MAAKDAAATVLFHFSVRFWTAFAIHENKNSADINRAFIVTSIVVSGRS